MVVGVSVSNRNMSARMADFYAVTIVDHVERGRTSLSSCWMCYCTLINQFITLEQRKSFCKQQTIDKNIHTDYFRDYHGDDWYFRLRGSKLGDFYRKESPFKGRHRHFGDRYRTLFYINVHFKWYIFRVKVPFKFYTFAVKDCERHTYRAFEDDSDDSSDYQQ